MSRDHDLMQIYIGEHRAASAAVAERLRQLATHRHLSFVHEIESMHRDVVAEGRWLEGLTDGRASSASTLKQVRARLVERVGRRGGNGRPRTTSPLTPLVETEILIAAITVKIAFLQMLAASPAMTAEAADVSELLDQAYEHYEDVTRWHRRLGVRAFATAASST